MGGREVGGLANQLAAHMTFSPQDVDRVRRFWKAPRMALHEGHKAVQMFEAIGRGEIKALWVMGTNPAVSLPDADAVRKALGKLELFVVSENVLSNDTVNSGAHVLLPAHAWGEKSGTVTNSERRISRQRAFLDAPGESKPDWWILGEIAKRLGFGDAFAFESAADVFREHALLSGFENEGKRGFDIGGLAQMSDDEFDSFAPATWPVRASGERPERFFAEGGFHTDDRKGRFVAPEVPRLKTQTSVSRPLRLNTGRIRDQWHTMTRTGLSPRLGQHLPEPFVEIHPDDAAEAGIDNGGFVEVSTEFGRCILKAQVSDRQQRSMLFAPIHWNEETASSGRVGSLVAAFTDPFSGQPEVKATPAAIVPMLYAQRGFVLSRRPLTMPKGVWWSHVAVVGGHGYLLAHNLASDVWQDWFAANAPRDDIAAYDDQAGATYRAAAFASERIELCLFSGAFDEAVEWDAVKALFEKDTVTAEERRMLLSGRSGDGLAGAGPIVCACFGVGRNTIGDAIKAGACSVPAIGASLKAGTNCGSCIPELKRMLAQTPQETVSASEPEPLTA